MKKTLEIKNRDFWFKKIEQQKQNWALIDNTTDSSCNVYFIGDTSGLLDKLEFSSAKEAINVLQRNGFHRYSEDKKAQRFITPPKAPFQQRPHSTKADYSPLWYY